MKEVMTTARNILVVIVDGKAQPSVEVVVSVSEPVFRFDGGGGLERVRIPETVRFVTTPGGLRIMADSFREWADEADEVGKDIEDGTIELVARDAKKEPATDSS